MHSLILGSSSPFRASLLEKLGLSFSTISPDIDEQTQDGETAEQLVSRLSSQKAQAIAEQVDSGLIIGSDQVAVLNGDVLGKPGNHANAIEQLKAASGNKVRFLTGLTLLNASNGNSQSCVEPFDVHFKTLTDVQIEYYLRQEQPYQCAGSFKSEGFGISLFSKLDGDDPNSLIGLPLIRLIDMLLVEGIDVLQPAT